MEENMETENGGLCRGFDVVCLFVVPSRGCLFYVFAKSQSISPWSGRRGSYNLEHSPLWFFLFLLPQHIQVLKPPSPLLTNVSHHHHQHYTVITFVITAIASYFCLFVCLSFLTFCLPRVQCVKTFLCGLGVLGQSHVSCDKVVMGTRAVFQTCQAVACGADGTLHLQVVVSAGIGSDEDGPSG